MTKKASEVPAPRFFFTVGEILIYLQTFHYDIEKKNTIENRRTEISRRREGKLIDYFY